MTHRQKQVGSDLWRLAKYMSCTSLCLLCINQIISERVFGILTFLVSSTECTQPIQKRKESWCSFCKYALHVNYYVRKETYSNLEYFRPVSLIYTNHVILVAKFICNTSKEESKTVFESFETSFSSNLLCHYKQQCFADFWTSDVYNPQILLFTRISCGDTIAMPQPSFEFLALLSFSIKMKVCLSWLAY